MLFGWVTDKESDVLTLVLEPAEKEADSTASLGDRDVTLLCWKDFLVGWDGAI